MTSKHTRNTEFKREPDDEVTSSPPGWSGSGGLQSGGDVATVGQKPPWL